MFSTAQRRSLLMVSLSRIICDNTHICLVPSDPFVRTLHPDMLLPCTHTNITQLNLSAWKEPDTGRKMDSAYFLLLCIEIYSNS